MAYQSNNLQSPAAEYLFKIQLIVSHAEFKNKELAHKYETEESRIEGEKYIRAITKNDTLDTYDIDDRHIYIELKKHGYDDDKCVECLKNHNLITGTIRRDLLEEARKAFIDTYVDKNKYYCNLMGLPFPGSDTVKADRIFTIPDSFFELYKNDGVMTQGQPIHTLTKKYQELFMNSVYYRQLVLNFPDADYLRNIGSNSVSPDVARRCMDGELMNINMSKLSGYHRKFGNVSVSPDIVHLFTNVYKQTREYVYNTLRGDFSSIYPNYNNFIRFLTIYMAMGQTLNELMKKSSSMSYMNNTSANNYFMLYGLPSVIMEGQSMIDFLKQLRLLLMDKGTNTVYRVKDYIGYKYTDIYSLIMVKQQIFENGYPVYTYDEHGKASPVYKIVFRRMGTTADNTSYFKFRDSNVEYDWKEIASGDPRWWWWNDPEIDSMLYEMNYTLSNSKYIQLSTHMSMSDVYWQTVILLRGLLDNRRETQYTPLAINYDIGGVSAISVFDAVLCLIIMMNWNNTLFDGRSVDGKFYSTSSDCIDMLFNGLDEFVPNPLIEGGRFKLSSFNFNIRTNNYEFYTNELPTYEYVMTNDFKNLLTNILDNKTKNSGELVMSDVRKLYECLVDKLLNSTTIHQFRQVTSTYNNLFLVDPEKVNWYDDNKTNIIYLLSKKYEISETDIGMLFSFCETNGDSPKFIVTHDNVEYTLKIGDILNKDVKTYVPEGFENPPFLDSSFVDDYNLAVDAYFSSSIQTSNLPSSVKTQYKSIMKSKVALEINMDSSGPNSFEGLLMIYNPELYERLTLMKRDGSNLIYFMRAIVKALEAYSSSELSALEFAAIGEKDYMSILKEVISYFKSYMVEFTKEEFAYVMDGLFDNGGNSNMLRLYDEITNLGVDKHVKDSIALYDVSNSTLSAQFRDDNSGVMYDEAIIRAKGTYEYIKQLGYDILFDDGKNITKNEPSDISDNKLVVGTMVSTGNTYTIIIPTNMIYEEELPPL